MYQVALAGTEEGTQLYMELWKIESMVKNCAIGEAEFRIKYLQRLF
jgi:hypothetical protein